MKLKNILYNLFEVYNSMVDHRKIAHLINIIIRFIFEVFEIFVNFITFFLNSGRKKTLLPKIKSELLLLSASQAARKIKKRELNSLDLLKAYITRIKDVNPIINSVVEDRFVDALIEAREVDKMLDEQVGNFSDKPLLGVPFTVKETIAVKGLSNNGARSRVASHIAERDANAVKYLREAGAIPILVSNTPELCLYLETYNPKYGRTNNPYDNRRTAGGSSGGEASLVGAGGSVIGIGSDIAGSLRIPTFFCGVFGHKPTPGYVSNDGHIPTSKDPMWDFYFTLGPITRYAEDLPVMLKALIGDENKSNALELDEPVNLSKLKVFYMYGEGPQAVLQKVPGVECIKAMTLAINALKDKCGCEIIQTVMPEFKDTVFLTSQILQMKGIENVFQTEDDRPDDWGIFRILVIILKKLTFQTSASIPTILYGILKYLTDITPENVRALGQERTKILKSYMMDMLKDDAVLLYPSFCQEAPLHNRLCSKLLNLSYLTIFNLLGFPVTQCPVGQTQDDIPIGIQIVAAPHQDRLCIAVAQALEKHVGGWTPPKEA